MKIAHPLLLLFLSLLSCDDDNEKDPIPCIDEKITELQTKEVQNPPAEVWKWEADDSVYYYITSDCCDQFNYLYDENCVVICAPDGGFTGNGDRKCPTFNGDITKTLIWKDDRK